MNWKIVRVVMLIVWEVLGMFNAYNMISGIANGELLVSFICLIATLWSAYHYVSLKQDIQC